MGKRDCGGTQSRGIFRAGRPVKERRSCAKPGNLLVDVDKQFIN
jgi:hypothetical protein